MILSIPAPAALERKLHPTKVPPAFALQARRIDLTSALGRVQRGKGMARTADIEAQADTVLGAGIFILGGCRKVVLDADANGDLRAHVTNAAGFAGGFGCVGPMPDWMDIELEPGEVGVLVPATVEGTTVIYSGALSGKYYRVRARGRWRNDSTLPFLQCGPEGTTNMGVVGGGVFAGFRHGAFVAKAPGGSWAATGSEGVVLAASAGSILGSMADDDATFNNNFGWMQVAVKELP